MKDVAFKELAFNIHIAPIYFYGNRFADMHVTLI